MSKSFKWAAAVGCSVLLFTGCMSQEGTKPIDPPQETAMDLETLAQSIEQETVSTTLYYKNADGLVSPLSVNLPMQEGVAKQALSFLIEGEESEELLPEGFQALLPKGTEILSMDIDKEKHAVVDFNEAFTDYNIQDERKILEAVTWTLTEFPSIESVSLRVNGQPLQEMPKDGTPLDHPLTRMMGINLEYKEGVRLTQSMPVTLYFPSEDEQGAVFYIPVTRMVPYSENAALTAVQELAAGPLSKGLESVMLPDYAVQDADTQDQLAIVDFKGMGEEGQPLPAAAAEAVLLTLGETVHANQVQFMMDGKPMPSAEGTPNYSKPVGKPEHINPISL